MVKDYICLYVIYGGDKSFDIDKGKIVSWNNL